MNKHDPEISINFNNVQKFDCFFLGVSGKIKFSIINFSGRIVHFHWMFFFIFSSGIAQFLSDKTFDFGECRWCKWRGAPLTAPPTKVNCTEPSLRFHPACSTNLKPSAPYNSSRVVHVAFQSHYVQSIKNSVIKRYLRTIVQNLGPLEKTYIACTSDVYKRIVFEFKWSVFSATVLWGINQTLKSPRLKTTDVQVQP